MPQGGIFPERVRVDPAPTPRRSRADPPQTVAAPPSAGPCEIQKFTILHPKKHQQWMCQNKFMVKALRGFTIKRGKNGHFGVSECPHTRAATRTRTRTRETATRTRTRTRARTWKLKKTYFHYKTREKWPFRFCLV